MKRSEQDILFITKFLKTVVLFEGLSNEVLKKIANQISEKLIRCREILYLKGEVSEYVYIIRYGEISIEKDFGNKLILLGTKEVLAENSLMSGTNHSTTAQAVIDSLVYQIPGKLFLQLATTEKILSKNIIKLMGKRMRYHLDSKIESEINEENLKRLFIHIPLDSVQNFKTQVEQITKTYEGKSKQKTSLLPLKSFKNLDSFQVAEFLTKTRNTHPLLHIYAENIEESYDFVSLILQCDYIIFHDLFPEKLNSNKEIFFQFWQQRIRNFSGRCIRFIPQNYNETISQNTNLKTFTHKDGLARTLISKTRGLALGGGGARALSHVGLLKVLEREKIKIDYISGASFGAVIGAMYSNGLSAKEIEEKIEEFFGGIESAFDPTLPLISFFRGKNMRKMLKRAFGDKRIEELDIPFVTSAVDLQTGKEHIFDQGPITEALTSAMSLPGAFPPYRLGEKVLVDGGIINNIPENLIRVRGADVILGVNVSPMQEIIPVKMFDDRTMSDKSWFRYLWEQIKYPPILQIMARTITLEGREITRLKKSEMDLFVHFHLEEFQLFDFRSFKSIIQKGEQEAEKNLPEIKKLFK